VKFDVDVNKSCPVERRTCGCETGIYSSVNDLGEKRKREARDLNRERKGRKGGGG